MTPLVVIDVHRSSGGGRQSQMQQQHIDPASGLHNLRRQQRIVIQRAIVGNNFGSERTESFDQGSPHEFSGLRKQDPFSIQSI